MTKKFLRVTLILIACLLSTALAYGMEVTYSIAPSRVSSLPPHCQTTFKLLQTAHAANDVQTFKSLIKDKADISTLEPLWPLVMKLATRHLPCDHSKPENNPNFIRIVDKYNKKHETPMHNAARFNKLEDLKRFLTPQNVNIKNLNGESPLFIAVHTDNFQAVELLVNEGADVHAETGTGIRPLHTAFKLPISKLLCAHGACTDINQRDIFSQTPLFYMIGQGIADVSEYLIDLGADVNVSNMLGETILQGTCFTEFLNAPIGLKLCKKVLAAGARVNAQANDYRTALHLAIENKLPEHAQAMILHGADITIADRWGETPAQLIEEAWSMSAQEFVELCSKPNFKELLTQHCTKLAKQSFEFELPSRTTKTVRAKKSPKQKNRPTYNQRKEKQQANKSKKEIAPVTKSLELNKKPEVIKPTFVLAQRVLNWRNDAWLMKKELNAKSNGTYEYWKFLRKRLYHRLPQQTLETIISTGQQKLRPNETHTNHLDTQFVIEGEMQFKYNDNPWQPGKRCQQGFYHMTRGIDGQIYHVGFAPISARKTLANYLYEIPVEWISTDSAHYSAIFDETEGVRHVIYL